MIKKENNNNKYAFFFENKKTHRKLHFIYFKPSYKI